MGKPIATINIDIPVRAPLRLNGLCGISLNGITTRFIIIQTKIPYKKPVMYLFFLIQGSAGYIKKKSAVHEKAMK